MPIAHYPSAPKPRVSPAPSEHASRDGATRSARIGPNAVIQTAGVLRDRYGRAQTEAMLAEATGRTLDQMPTHMVDESEVRALVRTCLAHLGHRPTRAVLREAGQRTAEYLLANRIPRPVQWLLRVLPAQLGVRILSRAMAQHAWTFAGSGYFHVQYGRAPEFTIGDCPLCRGLTLDAPVCDFYAGTFEVLLARLIRRDTCVAQVESAASGGRACRYEVRWA
jgi:divinyl protochlorophyllide a 8-vinyl-reductase